MVSAPHEAEGMIELPKALVRSESPLREYRLHSARSPRRMTLGAFVFPGDMAGGADGHGGKVLSRRQARVFDSGMATFAGDLVFRHVRLVRKIQARGLDRDLDRPSFFVTVRAIDDREIIGRKQAFRNLIMTINTAKA